jgi:hypothetical protein
MMTKSLKLNLKLVYQLTHRMMICPSKCRPLNNASIGTNRSILSSSLDHDRFAPEPKLPAWPRGALFSLASYAAPLVARGALFSLASYAAPLVAVLPGD